MQSGEFAEHYHLFRGTPTRLWLDQAFSDLFGMEARLNVATADHYFDRISGVPGPPEFRPRALFEQFKIEVIAHHREPTDLLKSHAAIRGSGWKGRVVTAYRPDPVIDPEFDGFRTNLEKFGAITGYDIASPGDGYLEAQQGCAAPSSKQHGATSTDHGHRTGSAFADLPQADAERLFFKVVSA